MGLLSNWLESLDYDYEILSSCTRHRSRQSTCEKCVTACNEHAISMQNGKPVFDSKLCSQCGKCMASCPVQAIAGIFPKRKIVNHHLVISKDSIPTSIELLILYKKGIQTIIAEDEASLHSWKEVIEQTNSMLNQLEETPFSISKKHVNQEAYYSRREFFSLWKTEGKSIAKEVTPAKWRFNHHTFNLLKYYDGDFQFVRMQLDLEKCTLCGVCQRFCDRKCFDLREIEFILNGENCSSCQLCTDICPEKAIKIEEKIVKKETILFPIYEKVCEVCNKEFKTVNEHGSKCIVCYKSQCF